MGRRSGTEEGPRAVCAYCGLPVSARAGGGPLFCCAGCSLVSRIVGRKAEGPKTWEVLRLSVGALLAMEVMMLSLLLYTGTVEKEAAPIFHWAMLGLATGALTLTGYPFLLGAIDEVRRRRLSLQTLIATGSLAAFLTSAANTVRGSGQVYFDTATMLPVLVLFGRLIEATAKTRTGQRVLGLETLLPERARRLEPDGPREAPIAELRVGDRLQVRPGERIAADGRILDGRTVIEEAAFTGEARPRACGPGDAVLAGTVNGAGGLVVQVERTGEELLLRRIAAMAEEARRAGSRIERLADRAAAVFVPAVVLLALAAGAYWALAEGWAPAGTAALAVLVVACPCAMGIATPLATALAIGRAAREGILVRGGDVLERVGVMRTIFLDKTGTLTTEQPTVCAIEVLDGETREEDLLGWLAGLESGSEHALGRAVVTEARARGIDVGMVREFCATAGEGASGIVTRGGRTLEIMAGSGAVVRSRWVDNMAEPGEELHEPSTGDSSVIGVAWGGKLRGRVCVATRVREDAARAVREFQRVGVCPVLLSGDRPEAAESVARQVGIERVEAPRRPEEKIAAIRTAKGVTGMVGDGLNDAPALSAAHVGIALGAGTDLARQAGNVVLLSNRLEQIPWLVALSRRTRRIIVQNLAWAFGYNALALAAAAAGLLHPLLAAVAMVVSSVTVLANSLRIQRFPPASEGLPASGQAPGEGIASTLPKPPPPTPASR